MNRPKPKIRNNFVLDQSIGTYAGLSGPVIPKRISDYSAEDQARWASYRPPRNRDGDKIKRPIVAPPTKPRG